MKTNRTALIAAAVTVAASLAVGALAASQNKPAQDAKPKGEHHRRCGGHLGKFMSEKLNLTDAQKEKLKAIRTDMKLKAKAIKQNESIDREAKKAQFKALKDAAKLQIDQVLTPDQKNQISKMREEAKARRAARKAAKPATA